MTGRERGAAVRARGIAMGVCSALAALMLVAAYVLDYFTHARMGMARHMVYLRNKWTEALPVETLRVVGVVVVVLVVAALVMMVVRGRSWRSPLAAVSVAVTVALAVVYAAYTLGVDPQEVRAHIAVSPLLGLAVLFQAASAALACRSWARSYRDAAR